jgi:hypothetical protein
VKAGALFLAIALVFVSPLAASDYSLLTQLEGAFIVSEDGHFLGVITTNSYDAKSILNEYGDYGSEYSDDSIFNQYGDYGGQYAEYSPFNEYTSTPPKIYTKDHKWAYLTVNRALKPRVDPHWLIGILKANE